jgi:hypothetical protein
MNYRPSPKLYFLIGLLAFVALAACWFIVSNTASSDPPVVKLCLVNTRIEASETYLQFVLQVEHPETLETVVFSNFRLRTPDGQMRSLQAWPDGSKQVSFANALLQRGEFTIRVDLSREEFEQSKIYIDLDMQLYRPLFARLRGHRGNLASGTFPFDLEQTKPARRCQTFD